jgi:hypothetical protein
VHQEERSLVVQDLGSIRVMVTLYDYHVLVTGIFLIDPLTVGGEGGGVGGGGGEEGRGGGERKCKRREGGGGGERERRGVRKKEEVEGMTCYVMTYSILVAWRCIMLQRKFYLTRFVSLLLSCHARLNRMESFLLHFTHLPLCRSISLHFNRISSLLRGAVECSLRFLRYCVMW